MRRRRTSRWADAAARAVAALAVAALAIAVGGCAGRRPQPIASGWHAVLPPASPSAPSLPPDALQIRELGRAQSAEAVGALAAALKAGDVAVRREAAFALGQLGVAWWPIPEAARAEAERVLVAALADEHDALARERLIEALGKLARGPGVDALLALLPPSASDPAARPNASPAPVAAERARAAIALGLVAKAAPAALPERALPLFASLATDGDPELRWAGVYALYRARHPARTCLADGDPLVRALCAKALGESGVPSDAPALAPLLDDADLRPAAEAGRALAKLTAACEPNAPCPPLDALDRPSLLRAPVMAAIAAEPITDPRAVPVFAALDDGYASARVPDRATRGRAQCRAALAHDRALGRLDRLRRCGLGALGKEGERARGVLEAQALAGFAVETPERLAAALALSRDAQAAVRAAAASALGALTDGASAARLVDLLADADGAVVAAAAEAVERRQLGDATAALLSLTARFAAAGPDGIEPLEAIASALGTLGARDAVPALRALCVGTPIAVGLAAAQALGRLGEKPPALAPTPAETRVGLDEPLPPAPRVLFQTERGVIHVRLRPEDAPLTVRAFLHLVRAHFYDGLTFHRVVPGFVAQGGDPRGDGSGGPGWALPCEITPRRFAAGTLGMALAGRDTGGSQFFFAHTPQPHLDGRYTTFGEITGGLDVALSLVEGDHILRILEEP